MYIYIYIYIVLRFTSYIPQINYLIQKTITEPFCPYKSLILKPYNILYFPFLHYTERAIKHRTLIFRV